MKEESSVSCLWVIMMICENRYSIDFFTYDWIFWARFWYFEVLNWDLFLENMIDELEKLSKMETKQKRENVKRENNIRVEYISFRSIRWKLLCEKMFTILHRMLILFLLSVIMVMYDHCDWFWSNLDWTTLDLTRLVDRHCIRRYSRVDSDVKSTESDLIVWLSCSQSSSNYIEVYLIYFYFFNQLLSIDKISCRKEEMSFLSVFSLFDSFLFSSLTSSLLTSLIPASDFIDLNSNLANFIIFSQSEYLSIFRSRGLIWLHGFRSMLLYPYYRVISWVIISMILENLTSNSDT